MWHHRNRKTEILVDTCCSVKVLRVSQVSQVAVPSPCDSHCGDWYQLCLLCPYDLDFYTFSKFICSRFFFFFWVWVRCTSTPVTFFPLSLQRPTGRSPSISFPPSAVPGRTEVLRYSTDAFFATFAVSGCVLPPYSELLSDTPNFLISRKIFFQIPFYCVLPSWLWSEFMKPTPLDFSKRERKSPQTGLGLSLKRWRYQCNFPAPSRAPT